MPMKIAARCDAAFKQAVLLACYDALAGVGFSRFRKEAVDWPLGGGFHCWVGLNTGLERAYLEINPFVGAHVVPIMKLYTRLEGRSYSRSVATYAIHMGELTPDEPAFRFTPDADIDEEAARLARLYAGAGLAYARSIATYEYLLPLLRERVEMLGAYPERVACCLYLMGKIDEARAFTEEFLQRKRNYFEGFAVPFLKMLDEEGRSGSAR